MTTKNIDITTKTLMTVNKEKIPNLYEDYRMSSLRG